MRTVSVVCWAVVFAESRKSLLFSPFAHSLFTVELEEDLRNDDIMVSIYSGVYGILSLTIEDAEFCRISSLSTATTDDDGNNAGDDDYAAAENNNSKDDDNCPVAGFYSLQTSFSVSSFEVDTSLHYIPDLRLLFYNSTSVIGCAQTGTLATYTNATTHAEMGMIALGIAMLVLGTCFGLMLYLTYRRKKRIEREMLEQKLKSQVPYVRTTSQGRVPSHRYGSDNSRSSSDV